MTRLTKETEKAITTGNFVMMKLLGKIDFECRGLHLTAVNGRLVHKAV